MDLRTTSRDRAVPTGAIMTLARLALILVLTLPLAPAARAAQRAKTTDPERYAGWMLEAYPDLSASDMSAAMARMRGAGANLLWIGHANPAAVNPDADEVGLSYPVFAAATDPANPAHAAAQRIVAAQRRALEAARSVGLKVVLPIGYRTQMGAAWSASHQESLRRGHDGRPLDFGGLDASPYAGDFRRDSARYYRWVAETFVHPYRDVVLMVNIADEPSGVDYSAAADDTFRRQTGYRFADVGDDPARVAALGAFQSRVMVDFAVWAAGEWFAIDPTLAVTMSFCGAIGRNSQQGPPLEPLFRDTPPNFQPTWDAYLRDGTAAEALNDSDVTALAVMLGTAGHLSARYQRPYWLWSAGNSWGLGQASDDPSQIADAVVNVRMLADVSRQAGGLLRGIAVFNYNQRGHGLYRDRHRTVYDPDQLFERVSGAFGDVRRTLEGPAGRGADAIVLAPEALPHRLMGASRLVDIWHFRGYNFGDLVSLVRSGSTVAVLDTLAGADLSRVRLLVVLAREPDDLRPADLDAIRTYRAAGGTLVVGQKVNDGRQLRAQWVYPGNAPEPFFADVHTADNVGPIAALGLPRLANSFALVGPREVIVYGGTSRDAPEKMRAWLRMPYRARAVHYGTDGRRADETVVGVGVASIPTRRHTFALIPLVPLDPAPDAGPRGFPQTGYRVDDDAIFDYFTRHGGVRTFGYPISRPFSLRGLRTQLFQRAAIQLGADGSPRLLNLLDDGLMPYTQFNGTVVPTFDGGLVATAPSPVSADYARLIVAWTIENAPNTWGGLAVGFGRTFVGAVTLEDAYPGGRGDLAALPLLNLEIWGVPTSRPACDPNNHDFIYQCFQRGIMHYDRACGCARGVLIGDYLKSILTGQNLPADLARDAASSPLFRQYNAAAPAWVHDPSRLPSTDLTRAFQPDLEPQ